MKSIVILIFVLVTWLPFPSMAQTDNPGDFNTVSFYLENDVFASQDRHYTSGLRLTWISRDLRDYQDNYPIGKWSYPLIKKLPIINEPGFQRAIYVSLGQNIYTPDDIYEEDLIEDDRPFAGYTYLAIGFQSKDSRRMNTLEFDLGIVGPLSRAEEGQKLSHQWLGADEPQGWENQIDNELAFNLIYLRKTKLWQSKLDRFIGFDVIPHMGFALGNVDIYGTAGAQVRFGWNLPNDFGTFLIRPGCECNVAFDRQDSRFFSPKKVWYPYLCGC